MFMFFGIKLLIMVCKDFNHSFMRKFAFIIFLIALAGNSARGQVLISLLLGDKLNSEKLEFGLDGGLNWSSLSNLDNSKALGGLHLGFYFDIQLKDPLYLHTGVIVKSPMGAKGIAPYSVGDPDLDSVLVTASVERKLRYFNVPLLLKYKFSDHFFAELGPQLGLLYKAFDEFSTDEFDQDDLIFKLKIRDQYRRLDAGITAGVGYRILKGNGMNIGVRYYFGLVNILKDNPGGSERNSSFYTYVGIPIGAGRARAASDASEKN
jgi:hypothetical protein